MMEDIIKIEEDGVTKEYKILLVYNWSKTNKFYIVYTDETKTSNNELNIYASTFDPEDMNKFYNDLTDEEYDEVERRLKSLGDNNGR